MATFNRYAAHDIITSNGGKEIFGKEIDGIKGIYECTKIRKIIAAFKGGSICKLVRKRYIYYNEFLKNNVLHTITNSISNAIASSKIEYSVRPCWIVELLYAESIVLIEKVSEKPSDKDDGTPSLMADGRANMDQTEKCEAENPMEEKSFKQRLVSDAEKMAYRQGARKGLNMTHAVILYAAQTHLNFDGPKLGVLLEILESDFGKAMLAWGVGEGLYRFKGDNNILRNLSEELRVSGMDLGAEAGLDKLLSMGGELVPMVTSLVNAIKIAAEGENLVAAMAAWKAVEDSVPEKVRVAASNAIRIEQPEDEIEVDVESEAEAEEHCINLTQPNMQQFASCS